MINQSEHLERVSRSFAFCIAQLPEPLRSWVGLSYLLCRIVDTIEDAPFADPETQLQLFDQFENSLHPAQSLSTDWYMHFPQEIDTGEMRLLREAGEVVEQFHDLPAKVKPLVGQMVSTMIAGMRKFVGARDRSGILRLKSEAELDGYCYVVAGVVGEALSHILACVDSSFRATDVVLERARLFGEFLQKVNILKDQRSDEKQGRFLIPDRQEVWGSSFKSAQQSLAYLEALPQNQTEFRRFCAWSLFLGLETLRGMQLFGQPKVARDVVERVFSRVEEAFLSRDTSLKSYFEELAGQIWPESACAT